MKKILVGLDGSANSYRALEEALKLAKLNDSELHTISVEELPYFSETVSEIEEEKTEDDDKFHEAINKARQLAAENGYEIDNHILQEWMHYYGHWRQQNFQLLTTRHALNMKTCAFRFRVY